MDQSLVQSNKRSRDRLVASIKNLNEESLRRKVNDEWTIARPLLMLRSGIKSVSLVGMLSMRVAHSRIFQARLST